MHKLLSFIIALFAAISLHAEMITGDSCGLKMDWEFYTNSGALYLIGEGPMYDYSYENPAPWNKYKDQILSVQMDSRSKYTTIGSYAFVDCKKLRRVEMPNTVKTIKEKAFYVCGKLNSIQLSDSVSYIGTYAFGYTDSLTTISLPNSLQSIQSYAFWSSGLNSITIPANVKVIGEAVFYYCVNLPFINVSSQNQYFCSLNGVLMSKDLTKLYAVPMLMEGEYAIPSTVKFLDKYSFAYCRKLTKIIVPSSLKSIGVGAFYCCDIESMELNEGLSVIGKRAFAYCQEMTSLILPSTLQEVGEDAFYDCRKLTSLACKATTPPTCNENPFNNFDYSSCKLYVPENAIEAYKTADYWKEFGENILAIGEGIEEVKANPELNGRKVIYNGQVYILQEGKSYTLTGTEIK